MATLGSDGGITFFRGFVSLIASLPTACLFDTFNGLLSDLVLLLVERAGDDTSICSIKLYQYNLHFYKYLYYENKMTMSNKNKLNFNFFLSNTHTYVRDI